MRALVTGAGGFIGSHLVELLVERSWGVRALVHYRGDGSRGWLEESPRLPWLETVAAGDVRDVDRLQRLARGCDVIFNLAALISIQHSYEAPEQFLEVNGGGCVAALLAARATGARLVQMSTSEVYGTARYTPMDERHPTDAQSPYAASKTAADEYCAAFRRSFGVDVRIARPFNTYGPRQSQRAVIPNLIAQVLRDEPVLRVGTLTATRDFTFVRDTVRALKALGELPVAPEGAVNIGSGSEIAIGDLAALVTDALGAGPRPIEVDQDYVRPADSEVMRLHCDNSRAQKLLCWEPRTSLRDGIITTAGFLRERLPALRRGMVA